MPKELPVQIWEMLSIECADRAGKMLIHSQLPRLGHENCACQEVPAALQLCGWCHWDTVEKLWDCPAFTQ